MKYFTFLFSVLISLSSCKSHQNNSLPLLKAMTYNIRLDVASDGENAWPNRKNFLASQVLFYSPDILGVQEARPNQMKDLQNSLTNYEAIGTGRDGGAEGEHSSIFYNTEKLTVAQVHTFWLSETPTVFSKGWDAAYPRICTYALFTQKATNSKIWVFNTHLDHVGAEAQLKGIELIQQKIAVVNTDNYPVLLMGDFNVEPNSELITSLKQNMNDAKAVAKTVFGPNGTFNGFKFHEQVTRRIDYIMLSKTDAISVKKYGALSSNIDLKYPSDHFPVFIELMIN